MTKTNIRQQIKKLTDSGLLKRYDTGIYFIPGESIFKSGTQLSLNQVIEKKYLQDKEQRCGYVSGVAFANQLGLTTQVPMICEVVTNKATKDYREARLAISRIIIRRRCLLAYMEQVSIRFSDLEPYLPYYPDKIYKNLYETRLMNGIST